MTSAFRLNIKQTNKVLKPVTLDSKPPLDIERETITRYIGARIAFRRKQMNYTFEHLGSLIGVTRQRMEQIENDHHLQSTDTLWKLAIALQVRMDYFLEGLYYHDE